MNSEPIQGPAIACTLGPRDYKQRLRQIAALARDSLKSHHRNGLELMLRYDGNAADRVREVVRREQECCAFLHFTVREESDQIVVNVIALEEAKLAAETVFDQFIAANRDNSKTLAGAALVCAGIAAACGPACIAPMVLPSVALAGTGTVLAWLAGAYSFVTALAVLSVCAAWGWIWLQARQSCQTPNKAATLTVCIATLLALLGIFWPKVEMQLVRSLGE